MIMSQACKERSLLLQKIRLVAFIITSCDSKKPFNLWLWLSKVVKRLNTLIKSANVNISSW